MDLSHLSRKTALELQRPQVAAVAANAELRQLILRVLREAAPGWVADGALGTKIREAKLLHLFSSGVKQTHAIAMIPGVESRVDNNWYFRAASSSGGGGARTPKATPPSHELTPPAASSPAARTTGRASVAAAQTAARSQRRAPAQPAVDVPAAPSATAAAATGGGRRLSRAALGRLVTRFIAAAGPPGDVWVREADVVAHLRGRGLQRQLDAAAAAAGGTTAVLSSLQWVEAGVAADGSGAAYCLLPTYEPDDDDAGDDGDGDGRFDGGVTGGSGGGGERASGRPGSGSSRGYAIREEDDDVILGGGGGSGYAAAPTAGDDDAGVDPAFASAVRQILRTAALLPTSRGSCGGGAWIELSLMDELLAAQGLADAAGPEPLVATLARLPFVEVGVHPVTGELRFQLRAGAAELAPASHGGSGGGGTHRAAGTAAGAGVVGGGSDDEADDDGVDFYGGGAAEFVDGYAGRYAYEPTPETSQMPPPAPHEAAAVHSGRSFSHALRSRPPAPAAPPAPLTPQEAPPPGAADAARAADEAVSALLEFMEGRNGEPASGALAGSKVRDAMQARGLAHLLPHVPRVLQLVALPAARGRLRVGKPIDGSGFAVYLVGGSRDGGGSGVVASGGARGGSGAARTSASSRAGAGGDTAGDSDADDVDEAALEARVGSGGMAALRRWTKQQLLDNSRAGRWTTSSLLAHVWGRGVYSQEVRHGVNLMLKGVSNVVKVTMTVDGGGRGHGGMEFPLFYVPDAAHERPPPHLTAPGGAPELIDAVRRSLAQLAAQSSATARPATTGGGTTVEVSATVLVQALACDGVLPASVADLLAAVAAAAPRVVVSGVSPVVLRVPRQ